MWPRVAVRHPCLSDCTYEEYGFNRGSFRVHLLLIGVNLGYRSVFAACPIARFVPSSMSARLVRSEESVQGKSQWPVPLRAIRS